MEHLSEVVTIIRAGLDGNLLKVGAYGTLLAAKLEADGEERQAELIRATLRGDGQSMIYASNEKHNHMTRDIKPKSVCPACDRYYSSQEPEALDS